MRVTYGYFGIILGYVPFGFALWGLVGYWHNTKNDKNEPFVNQTKIALIPSFNKIII